MSTVLTVTPNPLLDFLSPDGLVPGTVTRSSGFTPMAAGKAINVGRILRRHGHTVHSVFFAGGHTGALLSDLVAADDLGPLPVPTAARMRVGFICAAAGERRQGSLLETGFRVSDREAEALVARVGDQLSASDLVLIGGSSPDPAIAWCYGQICEAAADAGVPCWVDSYGPGMEAALGATSPPALAKPNAQELATTAAWYRCPELHITDGPARVRVRAPQGDLVVTPPTVHEVNPVGSGDSYLAGLAHARLSGMDLAGQLAYAAAAGAANAARWDVAAIGPEDIAALEGQATVRSAAP